ncbi:toprim domain-containing protein [uncultured Sulfurimonas sp.]|uniref:toprim domain-containing protein n=1 Tax=uncultured Sulfurimonas sp. TaxID=291845 RepID=UPI0032B145BF
MKIEHEVIGRWLDVLTALGVDQRYLINRHGKCPFCGGRDRYRFDNKDGYGTFFCNHCGAGDGFKFLSKMFNWDFKKSVTEIRQIIGDCRVVVMKKTDPRRGLKAIAQKVKPINGDSDLVQYLKNRGITSCPDSLKEAELYYFEDGIKTGPFTTMVALITNNLGKGVSYHLTYTHKQHKLKCSAPKKIMTPVIPMKGAYVELYPVEEHICVAEGIETALSIHDLTGLPVISALNAQNLSALSLPSLVKKVEIWGDNDASYCGQRASYALAEQLTRKGVEVIVHIPPTVGKDWLDTLNETQDDIYKDWQKTAEPRDVSAVKELVKVFNTKMIIGEEQ